MRHGPRAAVQALLAFVLAGLLGADAWLGACTALCATLVFPPAPWRPARARDVLLRYGAWLGVWVVFAAAYLRVMGACGHPIAPQAQLLQLAEHGASLPDFWLRVLLIAGVAPVVEEVIFRGYLYAAVAHALPRGLTQLVVAALFGLAHGVEHALPIGALSLVFGHLRARTGSLLPSTLAHAAHNGLTVAVVVWWPHLLDLLYAR
ncbi:MAG: CPBP family intramembrane glutamic endopeptidase [Planctomycetota bacterium]